MAVSAEQAGEPSSQDDRATPAQRTKVIILAQVVVIVALVVVWSIIRSRRSGGSPVPEGGVSGS